MDSFINWFFLTWVTLHEGAPTCSHACPSSPLLQRFRLPIILKCFKLHLSHASSPTPHVSAPQTCNNWGLSPPSSHPSHAGTPQPLPCLSLCPSHAPIQHPVQCLSVSSLSWFCPHPPPFMKTRSHIFPHSDYPLLLGELVMASL